MRVARAPGRVNLIGEHTDYNDGFVLPIAIDRYTTVSVVPRHDDVFTVEATDLGKSDTFTLEAIERTGSWADYVRGVVALLKPRHGADMRVTSDVPRGAGLSSSAALEVAVGRALSDLPGDALALLCQRAENEFVGVQCGIMDPFVSANARAGHALLLDCRDLSHRHVPLPDGVAVLVCDSRLERRLTRSAYNERRASCQLAASLLGVPALRDATLDHSRDAPATNAQTRAARRQRERACACRRDGTGSGRSRLGRPVDGRVSSEHA